MLDAPDSSFYSYIISFTPHCIIYLRIWLPHCFLLSWNINTLICSYFLYDTDFIALSLPHLLPYFYATGSLPPIFCYSTYSIIIQQRSPLSSYFLIPPLPHTSAHESILAICPKASANRLVSRVPGNQLPRKNTRGNHSSTRTTHPRPELDGKSQHGSQTCGKHTQAGINPAEWGVKWEGVCGRVTK